MLGVEGNPYPAFPLSLHSVINGQPDTGASGTLPQMMRQLSWSIVGLRLPIPTDWDSQLSQSR
jgi:hypothetical protein